MNSKPEASIEGDLVPVEAMTAGLEKYLGELGLPEDDVLVSVDERLTVIEVLPRAILGMPAEHRIGALYLSKFTAACAAGLFDAALNYLWDETIRSLREKVDGFDLEYFYDTVTKDPERSRFRDAADLEKLEDWELISGCRAIGVISDIAFKYLDHIRDVRNYASAAHPNQNQITGLQLIGWLETCIKEVIAREPDAPAIEVRRLIHNIREQEIDDDAADAIAGALEDLPADLTASLLRVVVGMYSDVALDATVRSNLKLVAPAVWDVCGEDERYEVGVRFASLRVNAEIDRSRLVRELLELVGGLDYLPEEELAAELSRALDELSLAHNGWDNFRHERGPAYALRSRIPANGVVPKEIRAKYVKTVILARIGNGRGVSWAAVPIYDELIAAFPDASIRVFLELLSDPDVKSRLQFSSCKEAFQEIAGQMAERATSARLKENAAAMAAYEGSDLTAIELPRTPTVRRQKRVR